ncbi:MAG TPA: TadE/TadG family type IV pilus assembly protein [Candidatus Dormibacteraeota bacterium]|nr:TadE/TadG family type IV pilus assembly protein [Candidatus Dormibacteraeota bacterium]
MTRGQSLVELAICAPLVMLLAMGAVSLVHLAESREGLEAATQAAVAAAARAPDPVSARRAARDVFTSMVGGFPLTAPTLRLSLGDFARGGRIVAESSATVDLAWGGLPGIPGHMTLNATAESLVEQWRSHASPA